MAGILAAVFNLIIMLGLPLGTLVYLLVKQRRLVLPFLAGALTFTVSQLLTRVPLLGLLVTQAWYGAATINHPVAYSLLLGLSAGVFEEVGRYLAMLAMRKHRGFGSAVAFGIGHGGLEAIYISQYTLAALFTQMPLLMMTPFWGVAVSGVERLLTLLFHMGCSVMVMQAVQRKKPLWLLLAVLLHGLVDGALGILRMWGVGIWGIELWVAAFGIGMLIYTIYIGRKTARKQKEALHENPL